MAHSNIVEGTGEELLHHLEQFPHDYFRLIPLPKPQENGKERKAKKQRPSALGKYAFVAGGSEEFAKEKQAEIEREDRAR
ncbi:MAG TPA: hypothetical protein VFA07_01080 [Chthonomonadaceae bacterium]|nr:hypothetical protein [Chthonomonadaceae bacterium]